MIVNDSKMTRWDNSALKALKLLCIMNVCEDPPPLISPQPKIRHVAKRDLGAFIDQECVRLEFLTKGILHYFVLCHFANSNHSIRNGMHYFPPQLHTHMSKKHHWRIFSDLVSSCIGTEECARRCRNQPHQVSTTELYFFYIAAPRSIVWLCVFLNPANG